MNVSLGRNWAGTDARVRRAAAKLLVEIATDLSRPAVTAHAGASDELSHPLLARSAALRAAASNSPPLRSGSRGDAVRRLQLALLQLGFALPNTTKEQSAPPDGIFGQETLRAVRGFQQRRGLTVDGVVGENTLAAMDRLLLPPSPKRVRSDHVPDSALTDRLRLAFLAANPGGARVAGSTAIGLTPPTGARPLSATQRASATAVFGTSLDFSRIFLTNARGLGGAAFTLAIPLAPLGVPSTQNVPHIITLNVGTFTPTTSLLIHELAHAWQSQHSIIPTRYMANSVQSQGIAEGLRALGVDASAYYYKPGKAFGAYAAEQIACQVQAGVPSILSVIRSLPPHVPHPLNELSLTLPRWEVAGPGVDTSC